MFVMKSYAQRIHSLIIGTSYPAFSAEDVKIDGDVITIGVGVGQVVLDCRELTFMDERRRIVAERAAAS
jgi:hypothetical protein